MQKLPFLPPSVVYSKIVFDFPEAILLHSSSVDASIKPPRPLFFGNRTDRYSYIVAKPMDIYSGSSLEGLIECINDYAPNFTNVRPFFCGGAVGVIPYDSGLRFQNIKSRHPDHLLPYFLISENVIVFDHHASNCFVVGDSSFSQTVKRLVENNVVKRTFIVDAHKGVVPSKNRYQSSFIKIQDAIKNGETYQVNLSHEFSFPFKGDPYGIYQNLAAINPSPQACFIPTPRGAVVSSSPERLVSCKQSVLESRPIAGTRPRGKTPKEDCRFENDLRNSIKENAEHLMLLDLIRNDMGRVARAGSVTVPEERVIEKYATVQHLVSNVQARQSPVATIPQVLRSFFPSGTISGCPKQRTMELIDRYESNSRGYFYGSAGYIGWNKDIDFNILIRTMVCTNDRIRLRVGGGIVYDSDWRSEYEETCAKAQAQLVSLGVANVRIS